MELVVVNRGHTSQATRPGWPSPLLTRLATFWLALRVPPFTLLWPAQWSLQTWDCLGQHSPAITQTRGFHTPRSPSDARSVRGSGGTDEHDAAIREDAALALEATWCTWGCFEKGAVAQSYHALLDPRARKVTQPGPGHRAFQERDTTQGV